MGTQYKMGDQIVEAKGNYLLALKGNQGEFHDDIKLYFETHLQDGFTEIKHEVFSHVNGDHGRIETRNVWLISNAVFCKLVVA
jgi:predicted transposase YbfD/YdcC